ncbi:hypothetical protein QO002_005601 [Pararhizobium capsulatum DSM 1112]|uniref:Uncharacterized protein n=1 Tax=Pararhizobium capsulatum DSM 1112 TaxID=1121113 RepID=A0ABU0BYR4_9HYPH|nr:hypothetical protein [Pararhizobium capsulatum DSM 1112]
MLLVAAKVLCLAASALADPAWKHHVSLRAIGVTKFLPDLSTGTGAHRRSDEVSVGF